MTFRNAAVVEGFFRSSPFEVDFSPPVHLVNGLDNGLARMISGATVVGVMSKG